MAEDSSGYAISQKEASGEGNQTECKDVEDHIVNMNRDRQ